MTTTDRKMLLIEIMNISMRAQELAKALLQEDLEAAPKERSAPPEPAQTDRIEDSPTVRSCPVGEGSGASVPSEVSEPTPHPTFAKVVDDLRALLATTREEKDIPFVVHDAFAEDINLMTASQRSVFLAIANDHGKKLQREREESSRQRVEDAGGKGIREYMDEDRRDAAQAEAVGSNNTLWDSAGYDDADDDTMFARLDKAVDAVVDHETAMRTYDLLTLTKERRMRSPDMERRLALVEKAKRILQQHGV